MDLEINLDATSDIGSINRYVLSGDLLAGRVTTTVKANGTKDIKKSWYHLDHLNSTKCVTNTQGNLEVMYEYRAFGEELKKIGTGDAKYTYGGKELDTETNLYYFNARYYDATYDFSGTPENIGRKQLLKRSCESQVGSSMLTR